MGAKTDQSKIAAANAALELITPGKRLGLGTGSTTAHFIRLLGQRVREGLDIEAVATSVESEELARQEGIPIIPFDLVGQLDITVDGADEIDPDLNLIKGGGGALLREKIVAYHSKRLIIIADQSKRVETLGAFPLPVEVIPFWWQATHRAIGDFGIIPRIRNTDGVAFITDNGNLILDCPFGEITAPDKLGQALKRIPGIVEVGLFVEMAEKAYIGEGDSVTLMTPERL